MHRSEAHPFSAVNQLRFICRSLRTVEWQWQTEYSPHMGCRSRPSCQRQTGENRTEGRRSSGSAARSAAPSSGCCFFGQTPGDRGLCAKMKSRPKGDVRRIQRAKFRRKSSLNSTAEREFLVAAHESRFQKWLYLLQSPWFCSSPPVSSLRWHLRKTFPPASYMLPFSCAHITRPQTKKYISIQLLPYPIPRSIWRNGAVMDCVVGV